MASSSAASGAAQPAAQDSSPGRPTTSGASLLGVHKGAMVAFSLQDRGGAPIRANLYGEPLVSLSLLHDLTQK